MFLAARWASRAVGAGFLLAPGDRAVSWPCRWHRAPDDDRLPYEVESVIAVLTMHNVGFNVGTKAREVELYFSKIFPKEKQGFNAGRTASLPSLQTFKRFQKCILFLFLSISTSNHAQWTEAGSHQFSNLSISYFKCQFCTQPAIWMAAEGIKVAGECEAWFQLRHIQTHFKPFWSTDSMHRWSMTATSLGYPRNF